MRIDALDHLAVELQHQAQHAMRRRMLRPEIDGEVAERGFASCQRLATSKDFVWGFPSPLRGRDVVGGSTASA